MMVSEQPVMLEREGGGGQGQERGAVEGACALATAAGQGHCNGGILMK